MGRIQPVACIHVWYRQAVHESLAPSARVHVRYRQGVHASPAPSPSLPSHPSPLPALVCGLSTSPPAPSPSLSSCLHFPPYSLAPSVLTHHHHCYHHYWLSLNGHNPPQILFQLEPVPCPWSLLWMYVWMYRSFRFKGRVSNHRP